MAKIRTKENPEKDFRPDGRIGTAPKEGECYLAEYPDLRNPVNWGWVITTAIAAGTLIVALAAFLTSCHVLNQ